MDSKMHPIKIYSLMSFYKYIQLRNQYHKKQTVSITPKISRCPFVVNPFCLFPAPDLIWDFVLGVLSFPNTHINGSHNMRLCVWLFPSLSMFLRFIWCCVHQYIPVYWWIMFKLYLVTSQFADPFTSWWTFGSFPCLAILYEATVNILVRVLVWTYVFIFLGKYLAMRSLDHMVKIC